MAKDALHDRLLAITLSLPGAVEDWPWGSIHCKVNGKIFAGWSRDEGGEMVLGIRVDRELQTLLVASDPRFRIAKYVGQYGGVDMRIGPRPDWKEIEHLITESYRILAPKKLVKELDARAAGPAAAKAPRTKATAKKVTAVKPTAKKSARSAGAKASRGGSRRA
ncbi:MAG: MmcQ/YjbR family DNA-binding protein [Byssovorax sp.]